MNNLFHTLFGPLRNITLDQKRKADHFHSILQRTSRSPFGHPRFSILHWKAVIAVCTTLVMLVTSSGVMAYMVDEALPGDSLYSIKVHIGEEIVSYLCFLPEWKAGWEIKRMGGRLRETVKLTQQDDLDNEKLMTIIGYIENHAQSTNTIATEMGIEGDENTAVDVAVGLESSLRSYRSILVAIQRSDPKSAAMLRILLENLHAVESDTKALRGILKHVERGLIAEDTSYVQTLIDDTLEVAGNIAMHYYDQRESFEEEMTVLLDQRIQLTFATLESAEHLQESGNALDAFELVKAATQLLSETAAFVEIENELNIDIGLPQSSVSAHPRSDASDALLLARNQVEDIATSIAALPDDDSVFELMVRLQLAEGMLQKAEERFVQNSFYASQVLSTEVQQIVENIVMLQESANTEL